MWSKILDYIILPLRGGNCKWIFLNPGLRPGLSSTRPLDVDSHLPLCADAEALCKRFSFHDFRYLYATKTFSYDPRPSC